MKLKGKNRGKCVGLSSFIAVFAVLAVAVFCPFDGNNVEAASRSQRLRIDFVLREALATGRLKIDFFLSKSGDIDYKNIAKKLGIDFYIQGKINMGISGDANVNAGTVNPTVGGKTISKSSADLTVGTNNPAGLTVTAGPKDSDQTSMVNTAGYNTEIVATGNAVTLNDLEKNSWGFNISPKAQATQDTESGSLLYGMSTELPLKKDGGGLDNNGNQTLTLTYGAKVTTGVAAGDYTSSIRINVAPNPEGTVLSADAISQVEDTIEAYFVENPGERERIAALQAELRAQYEAEQNGVSMEEQNI